MESIFRALKVIFFLFPYCFNLFVYICFVLVILPLHVVCMVRACDDHVDGVREEQMISMLNLPLGGMLDEANTGFKAMFFSSFLWFSVL